MRAWRIADERRPLLDGSGASLYGARWNSPGRRIIYASQSLSLAMLEVLAHTNTGRMPRHHGYIVIDIPDAASIEWLDPQAVPGWDMPHCSQSRVFGDAWYDSRRSAVLVVPSVVCPHERNILINQAHPAFPAIRASEPLPLRWDARLFGGPPGG